MRVTLHGAYYSCATHALLARYTSVSHTSLRRYAALLSTPAPSLPSVWCLSHQSVRSYPIRKGPRLSDARVGRRSRDTRTRRGGWTACGDCDLLKFVLPKTEHTRPLVIQYTMYFPYSGSSKGSRSATFGTGLCALGSGNESPSRWRKSLIARGRSVKSCEASHQFNESGWTNRSPT